ncbi:CRAL-TRIO domain-containing protein [Panaeolus papilionaceus]|nr:CRAL-TRIO domain-containing protein [Panaeolus papilionaceus]
MASNTTTTTQTSSVPTQPTSKPSSILKAETAEPQNPLTHRFTQAEWDALKKFRSQLPDMLADAYDDKPDARQTPITLWGVTIDPTNPTNDARVSVVLMKFLRARNLNPKDARDMFINTLRWRTSFNVEAALNESFPQEVFGQAGLIYGVDKGNRPVVYNIYGGNQDLKAIFSDTERFIRWRVALMERSVALLDFNEVDQTLQIHDYDGVSLTSRDAKSKAAASEATNIFSSHYPELLYKKFFVNVPTLLNWIFWAFKPLLPTATLAKMSVVGTGRYTISKELLPLIDASNLPTRYGGEAEAF